MNVNIENNYENKHGFLQTHAFTWRSRADLWVAVETPFNLKISLEIIVYQGTARES